MKKQKVLAILVLSVIALAVIVAVSFMLESRSQKLPAVVSSDKVFISSEVSGVLSKYFVSSMQRVKANERIALIYNGMLPFKLETLTNEKRKYEELIRSARSGDQLKTELYRLDEDIQKNRIDLEQANQDIQRLNNLLPLMAERYINGRKKYDADKKLFDKGILSSSDYEKATKDFWGIQEDYNKLKADSLVAAETLKSSRNIIQLLQARKDILSGNEDMLAAKYVIDLNEVDANINDLQEANRNLQLYSPIDGVVTDINYNPGERVDKGDVIAEIADLGHIWITAYGSSSSRHRIRPGQKAIVYCEGRKQVTGRVLAVSPVMEKVKYLTSSYESANTYTRIEISLDDLTEALKCITPGERLFVRVRF
jgi:multidrug resistance efflux pump